MRSKERFTQLVGTLVFAVAGAGIGSVIKEATTRDNQVEGIQLVDCSSGIGLERNTLNISTLNFRGEPIHVGGTRSFYGTHDGSLNISPDEHGGIALEIPHSGSIEKRSNENSETIVFNSRGISYEITPTPVDAISTSLNIKASCEK